METEWSVMLQQGLQESESFLNLFVKKCLQLILESLHVILFQELSSFGYVFDVFFPETLFHLLELSQCGLIIGKLTLDFVGKLSEVAFFKDFRDFGDANWHGNGDGVAWRTRADANGAQ